MLVTGDSERGRMVYTFSPDPRKKIKGELETMNIDEYNASLEKQEGQTPEPKEETALEDFEGLFDFDESDDNEDTELNDENEESDEVNEDENDESIEDNEAEIEESEEEEKEVPEKKVQSKEENAKFAEQRRQAQLQKQLQESPEYKLAQRLANRYGVTVEQALQQLEEAEMQSQAEKEGVPVEVLKRQRELEQRIEQQELEFKRIQFESWQRRVDSEKEAVKKDMAFLSDEDIDQAVVYMLDKVKNPDLPLEEAVYAVHGKKIAQSLRDQAKQDALAEISGRTKSPLAPQGGKPNPTNSLTTEEKYVARQMGISEKDYLKYKTQS